MPSPTVLRAPEPATVAALRAIDDAVTRTTGHEAVPEAGWHALATDAASCVAVLSPDGCVGALTLPSDSFTPAFRQLAVAAEPDASEATVASVVTALLDADPATDITAWLPGTILPVAHALAGVGFTEHRRQHQMRVPLPLPEPARLPADVTVRPFVVGRDGDAWLAVNNRAFANHPDQGGWITEVLDRRLAEPWFDPAGFLLAWRDTTLVGFCWTKVHTEPEHLGEIFVIGVDPDAQGIGLGRALVLAGLDHLASVRQCPTGVLYVAADNAAAVHLYADLGFTITRTDTAYRWVRP